MFRLSGFFYNLAGKLQNWLPLGYNSAIMYMLYSAYKKEVGLFIEIHMAQQAISSYMLIQVWNQRGCNL